MPACTESCIFLGSFLSLGIRSPCQRMIGVYNHLLSKVFRFHYHSQKVIGSLGCVHFLEKSQIQFCSKGKDS